MSTLYFIRHGESVANHQRILASTLPYPLTKSGKSEATLIASELKEKVDINRIISSPLLRALETAEPFKNTFKLEIEIDKRISEQDLGKYKGISYDEVKEQTQYESDPLKRWDWIPDGDGESYSMIAVRVKSFFLDLESVKNDDNILIVTHAVTFRIIRGLLENTLPTYPQDFPNNGEIWKVDFKKLGGVHKIKSIFLGNSKKFIHNP